MEYMYKNGLNEHRVRIIKSARKNQEFIKVCEDEYYMKCTRHNNTVSSCYKIVNRIEDGKKFNVNMNNGIAYECDL